MNRPCSKLCAKAEIAGAGLDVFGGEPLDPGSPLLTLSNVVATPHIGGVTEQNYDGIARVLADNFLRVKRGEQPRFWVNEAALASLKAISAGRP